MKNRLTEKWPPLRTLRPLEYCYVCVTGSLFRGKENEQGVVEWSIFVWHPDSLSRFNKWHGPLPETHLCALTKKFLGFDTEYVQWKNRVSKINARETRRLLHDPRNHTQLILKEYE